MEKRGIYANKRKLDWWGRRITDSDFAEAIKKEILDFFDNCSTTGMSIRRIIFYADGLYHIANMLGRLSRRARL